MGSRRIVEHGTLSSVLLRVRKKIVLPRAMTATMPRSSSRLDFRCKKRYATALKSTIISIMISRACYQSWYLRQRKAAMHDKSWSWTHPSS